MISDRVRIHSKVLFAFFSGYFAYAVALSNTDDDLLKAAGVLGWALSFLCIILVLRDIVND